MLEKNYIIGNEKIFIIKDKKEIYDIMVEELSSTKYEEQKELYDYFKQSSNDNGFLKRINNIKESDSNE